MLSDVIEAIIALAKEIDDNKSKKFIIVVKNEDILKILRGELYHEN